MNVRLCFLQIAAVCALVPNLSFSNNYFYTAAAFKCEFYANRQAIGEDVKRLGRVSTDNIAVQLFKIDGKDSTQITSFKNSPNKIDIEDYLKVGGVPNPLATHNWSVGQNQVEYITVLDVIGSSLSFTLKVALDQVALDPVHKVDPLGALRVKFKKSISLKEIQEILILLGDTNTPNFTDEPPEVIYLNDQGPSSASLIAIDMSTLEYLGEWDTSLRWGSSSKNLRSGGWSSTYPERQSVAWGVQVHYPSSIHNGLSYHLYFGCGKI